MAAITTRQTAGTGASAGSTTVNPGPLSNAQLDTNFINLNNDILDRLPLTGGSLTGTLTSTRSYTSTDDVNVNGSNFIVNTSTKSVALYAYDVQRSGTTVGGLKIDGSGVFATGTTIAGNVALHAGNYNTYAPTLTGTGASGTWSISVSGNAGTVTNGVYTNGSYADPAWITSLSKSKVGLGNVENTALSTWAGSTSITTIGVATATSLTTSAGNVSASNAVIAKGDNGTWTGKATFLDYNTANDRGRIGAYDYAAGTWKPLYISSASATVTVDTNLVVTGTLTVNGTTTTVNSTTVTIDDPIFTLGGDTAPTVDDNKDRGIEFRWHNGTAAKIGFFGYDDSTGYLTFIPDATNTSEVFSGTQGDIQATNFRGALIGNASTATNVAWSGITSKPTTLSGFGITDALSSGGGTITGNLNIVTVQPVLILRDSDNSGSGVGQTGWISYQDSTGTERAWIGYGSASSTDFNINNGRGDVKANNSIIVTASNYNSYSPTLTGTGASGTWGVNITGTAKYNQIQDTRAAQLTPDDYLNGATTYEFTNQLTGGWTSLMTLQGWADGYASWQIIGPAAANAPASETWYLRSGVGTTWNSLKTILHSGNYNTYSPTLTGTGASGTWGISVTGNAGSATSPTFSGDSTSKADVTTRTDSGFWQTDTGTLAEGWPTDSGAWHHLLSVTHSNDSNYYALQLSSRFDTQNLYFRNTNGSGTQAWSTLLHSGNYNSYALPLTGGTLTGSIKINTTGSGSGTSHLIIKRSGAAEPSSFGMYAGSWRSGIEIWNNDSTKMLFLNPPENDSLYSHIKSVGGGFFVDVGTNGSTRAIQIESTGAANFPVGLAHNGNAVLTTGNYNSYSPTLTGTGASGTWGISISGNAASSTRLINLRTINGTGFDGTADIVTTEWIHSSRDFINGTLITTSIDYSQTAGDPFVLQIRGNSYGVFIPFDIQIQGYIYTDTIIHVGGTSTGPTFNIIAQNVAGKLCFWFARQSYWQGFNVHVYTAQATRALNKVVSITDVVDPNGTKRVTITPEQVLRSGNYNNYSPTLTGTGASGTWGINVTGSAGSVAWTNVSGRPTAVSSFTNDSGYITSSYSGFMLRNTVGQTNPNINFTSSAYRFDPNANNPTSDYYAIITYGNDGNVTGQLATHYTSGQTFTRAYNTAWSSWRTQLDSSNYNSYSPSLTGTGASGTWAISISGNASGAARYNEILDTRAGQLTPNDYTDYRATYEFTDKIVGSDWHSAITMQGWSNGYSTWQIIGPSSSSGAHENWYLRSGVNTTWNTLRTILHSGNYNTYSPTLTGTGASGTWGISITGNAATAAAWQTTRTLTVGSTGKSVNGSADVSWSLAEIGAAASNQTFFFGTTSIAINRSSAALALSGITSITGDTGSTFTLQAAAGVSPGNTGQSLTLRGGNGNSAPGGTVTVRGGAAPTGTGGGAVLAGGDTGGTTGGSVDVFGGAGQAGASAIGGAATVRGGDSDSSATAATGGNVIVRGGVATTTNAITKVGGSVYIDGGQPNTGGTITSGSVFIGNQTNSYPTGTTHVTIGKSGTEVRLPGVGTSGFVKLGANGTLSADTNVATTGKAIAMAIVFGG
jgi:hypothetical protein